MKQVMKKFHPMALLLKFEGYPPAVIASLFLHGCLLLFILGKSVDASDFVSIEDPVIVTATAIDVNPQRLRRIERIEREQAQAAAVRRREQAALKERQEREQRENAAREAREREQQEARAREEAERRRQEELAREQAREDAERERLAEQARAREAEQARRQEAERQAREQAAREAEASQIASENLLVAEYSAKIRQIITQSWLIPPSARNGMSALVRLQLVPTGEVVGVTVVQGSGNAAFDQSVIQAVERAERFYELQDLDTAVFERNFRTFDLLFRPEDLLR